MVGNCKFKHKSRELEIFFNRNVNIGNNPYKIGR